LFTVLGTGVARSILKAVTTAYAVSMRWLYIFMAVTWAGSFAFSAVMVWQRQLSGASLSAALGLFALPPTILLMYVAYTFKRETSR
jgi:hypothetical protein